MGDHGLENLDLVVLRALRGWRAAGRHALLATVARTWGSSPRPVGSIMALCANGAVSGSVSGGCVEDDLIHQYSHLYHPEHASAAPAWGGAPPARVKYGISADEAHRFGLPCGGTLELVLEFDPDPALLDALLARLEGGQLVARSTDLATGQVSLADIAAPAAFHIDDARLTNTYGPEYRMLIIGAGQLSEYLATMALFNGFAVTVCDPRSEYADSWSVARATLERAMPDDLVQAFKPDRRSAVVALTHDPKLDDLALLEALASEAFYIGAIGSRKNNQARHARLIEHFGQTEASLGRLRGPIGLYIGSKTPPEIAVSIMAEILAVKNGVRLPRDLEVAAAKDQLAIAHDTPAGPVCAS